MSLRLPFIALLALACSTFSPLSAQEEARPLRGKVQGNSYVSPSGAFRFQIPVHPELGGTIEDNDFLVSFVDGYTTYVSITCLPIDPASRLQDEMLGRREFLISFFKNRVGVDFKQSFPDMTMESANFLTKTEDGALLISLLLPGGSMFNERLFPAEGEPLPTAKRGNLLFVKNDYIFILSTEIAEKVLERSTYKKTVQEEDQILRAHLLDVLSKITFTTPAKKAAADVKPAVSK